MDSKADGADFLPFPPWSFVERWNAGRPQGQPYRTAADPLVMLAWHHTQAASDAGTPLASIIKGL